MNGRAAATLVLLAALSGACGEVVFIDPDADLKASLQLERVDHFVIADDPRVYLHVRWATTTSTAGTELIALTPQGSFQLPWAAARPSDCGPDRRCAAFVLPPGTADPERLRLWSAPLSHVSEVRVRRTALRAHRITADSRLLNQRIRVDVFDPIRDFYVRNPGAASTGTVAQAQPFQRDFEVHIEPGPCGAAPATDAEWASSERLPEQFPARFSAAPEGLACAWVRPRRPLGGPPVGRQTVEVRAEVSRFQYVYRPPIERAPIVFVPFFDLEIPNPARCEEAEGLFLSAVLEAATEASARTGAPVLALPAVELAEVDGVACRQADFRAFDVSQVLQRTREAVRQAFPAETRVRVIWIYAQNLSLPISTGIISSFTSLRSQFRTGDISDYMLAVTPDGTTDQLVADRTIPWLATEEPQFRRAIRNALEAVWPFSTVVHTNGTLVSLVSDQDRNRFEAYRICRSGAIVRPVGEETGGPGTFRPGLLGPAVRMNLQTQILVPSDGLFEPAVVVEWAGCEDYCDRQGPDSQEAIAWLEASGC